VIVKLTPQDILTQTFAPRLRGFDRDEVKSFLIQVAEALENEIQEKETLRRDFARAQEKLTHFERREQVLRDTLVSAQKFSKEIEQHAQKESELIVREAEMKGEQIINGAMGRMKELNAEIRNLKFKRREIEDDLVHMLNSLKEMIESYREQDAEFDKVEYLGK